VKKLFATAGLVLSLIGGSASAATITRTFTFSADMPAGPISTYVGSATLTFDPSLFIIDGPAILHYSSTTPASPLTYSYFNFVDRLVIGGSQNSASIIQAGTDDFFVSILHPASDNPMLTWLSYSTSKGATGNAYSGKISVVSPTAVPEPATWAMLLFGMFGAGAVLRRRRAVSSAVAYP
jgi:hypothetical protein